MTTPCASTEPRAGTRPTYAPSGLRRLSGLMCASSFVTPERSWSACASRWRATRHADLTDRLAAKHKERDRWLHLYAQGHISDVELETHLADLSTQLDNLKLLLESVEAELEARREHVEVVETAASWLMTLRERVEEIEEDTEEAYAKRRQLVKRLVERIVAGRDANGNTSVRITYRFGPPEPSGEEDGFVTGVENGPAQFALKHSSNRSRGISRMPPI
jgi:hypothetical protein